MAEQLPTQQNFTEPEKQLLQLSIGLFLAFATVGLLKESLTLLVVLVVSLSSFIILLYFSDCLFVFSAPSNSKSWKKKIVLRKYIGWRLSIGLWMIVFIVITVNVVIWSNFVEKELGRPHPSSSTEQRLAYTLET